MSSLSDRVFRFVGYSFDPESRQASFKYAYDNINFCEELILESIEPDYNRQVFDRALFLAWILAGTSYWKTLHSRKVELGTGNLDAWQADFFNKVYQEGMGQFAFENSLTRDQLAHFTPNTSEADSKNKNDALSYGGDGIIALQSGGKDSLLTASLLLENNQDFTPWYVPYSGSYPEVLNELDSNKLRLARRKIDTMTLRHTSEKGGLNGHVPVTYIIMSYALLDAIATNKKSVLVSIGHEGEEPHDQIGDLPVNHQWAKTWQAEQDFADYVRQYISPDLQIGSPLRGCSELKIAELFAEHAWLRFGNKFSSCNLGNYKQGHNNTQLGWCGECPKCANSFLLFAPFIEPVELKSVFNGKNLLRDDNLQGVFKGLLGVDGVMKPLECISEVDELRLAYHIARDRWPDAGYELSFDVPNSNFDYGMTYTRQSWVKSILPITSASV
jgi:hypothetical protein